MKTLEFTGWKEDVIDTQEVYRGERLSLNERNDCVVRAIASVFCMTYEQAHNYCKHILHRKNKKGTYTLNEFDGHDYLSGLCTALAFNQRHKRMCKHSNISDYTEFEGVTRTGLHAKKFVKHFNKGTYLVLSSGHAWCCKNGVIYGNPSDDRTYVKLAYRVDGDYNKAVSEMCVIMSQVIYGKSHAK